jgi:hypothetical protein
MKPIKKQRSQGYDSIQKEIKKNNTSFLIIGFSSFDSTPLLNDVKIGKINNYLGSRVIFILLRL